MSPIDPRSLEIAQGSDLGLVRSAQEDLCDHFEEKSGARLFVVADGMGGHRGGATASRLAVEAMGETLTGDVQDVASQLADAFRNANARIYQAAREDPELRGMGTTAVVLLVDASGSSWIGHVGDSRAYMWRNGKMLRLTEDHSVVAEMVRRGLISEKEAESHPRRNEILRSIGVEPDVVPELREIELRQGDRLLLCSDGLCGLVPDEEIASVLGVEDPRPAVQMLIDAANALGGPDNITAQVVRVPGEPDPESTTAPVPIADLVAAAKDEASEEDSSTGALPLLLLAALVAALAAFAWLIWRP